ncbi:MAG: pantetheine-phosphate adenylyltransferase [Cytophagales bacterium]|jgi:pantetheine-phosphate adenylyltransferase|nr:pantetheine-phosphate adenylyltransferase [Cytophagales bacterium]
MTRVAIFPGSFDPFTKGHQDIVLRGLGVFDKIIVAIGYNSAKSQRYFPIEFMVEKINETFKDEPRISVQTFSELTAEFAKRNGARYLLRGLRNTTDFEYENSIAQVNRQLNPELESVFLITSPAFAAISSSIIREVHRYNGDVSSLIPYKL